jgi:putative colanic acid biosynthesis UDP-glucose lipid carrier transferase
MKKLSTKIIPYFTLIGAIADFISLIFSLTIASYFHYFHFDNPQSSNFSDFFYLINLIWFIFIIIGKPYSENRINLTISRIIYNFIIIVILHLLVVSFIFSNFQNQYITPLHLLLTYSIFISLGILWRVLGIYFIRWYRISGYSSKRFVIVGFGELSSSIVEFYQSHLTLGHKFQGYYDEDINNNNVYSLDKLEQHINEGDIDFIYCCQPYISATKLQKILTIAQKYDLEVKLLVDFRGFMMKGLSVEYHDIIPILKISQTPPKENYHQLKRAFDICFSLIALILGSPIFIMLAILTKLSSRGPIFFSQKRTGQWGKPFKIYKFRSMYVNADEIADRLLNGDKHSIGHKDPRITPWGHFMRKTRLDELPQFFNVLIGDMSIVGPRPLPDYDIEMLTKEAPNSFQRLLAVKPGITSLGQLYYGYASTAHQNVQRMRYDLIYLEKLSFKLDIVLIFKTLRLMLQQRGQ